MSGKKTPLVIRGTLQSAYADVLTPDALAALNALAGFDAEGGQCHRLHVAHHLLRVLRAVGEDVDLGRSADPVGHDPGRRDLGEPAELPLELDDLGLDRVEGLVLHLAAVTVHAGEVTGAMAPLRGNRPGPAGPVATEGGSRAPERTGDHPRWRYPTHRDGRGEAPNRPNRPGVSVDSGCCRCYVCDSCCSQRAVGPV